MIAECNGNHVKITFKITSLGGDSAEKLQKTSARGVVTIRFREVTVRGNLSISRGYRPRQPLDFERLPQTCTNRTRTLPNPEKHIRCRNQQLVVPEVHLSKPRGYRKRLTSRNRDVECCNCRLYCLKSTVGPFAEPFDFSKSPWLCTLRFQRVSLAHRLSKSRSC